jgi:phage gpG-like protein
MSVKVILDTDKLDEHISELAGRIEDQTRAVAFQAERMMKENADIMDIYDTGALINSIAVEEDGKTFRIGPHVDYAIWQEFGHHNVPARPFVTATGEWMCQQYSKPEEWKKVVE